MYLRGIHILNIHVLLIGVIRDSYSTDFSNFERHEGRRLLYLQFNELINYTICIGHLKYSRTV